MPYSGPDCRHPSPGVDNRFSSPGVDARFPSPGVDSRFANYPIDARFQVGCPGYGGGSPLRTAWFFAPNESHVMTGVVEGAGSVAIGRTNTIWVLDQDTGFYGPIAGSNLGFEDGRIVANTVYDTDSGDAEFADPPYLRVSPAGMNKCQDAIFAGPWSVTPNVTFSVTGTGLDGSANQSAIATDTGTFGYMSFLAGATGDLFDLPAAENCLVVWVKAKTSQTNDARIELRYAGGTAGSSRFYLNCVTGVLTADAVQAYLTGATVQEEVIGGDTFWKVTLGMDNSSAGNTNFLIRLYPGNGETTQFSCPMMVYSTPYTEAQYLPPIITSGSVLFQDADTYTLDSLNFDDAQGAIYFEALMNGDDNLLNGFLYRSGGNLVLDDGTLTVSAVMSAGVWHEVGLAWDDEDGKMDLFLDGVWIGFVSYDGTMLSGALDIMRSTAYGGRVRNLQIYEYGSP